MNWLEDYRKKSAATDKFANTQDHEEGLVSGLIGEAGSIVSELKKHKRDRKSYPIYMKKLEEEFGDYLWYYVQIGELKCPQIFDWIRFNNGGSSSDSLPPLLDLSILTAYVVKNILESNAAAIELGMRQCWWAFKIATERTEIPIEKLAAANLQKIASRWPRSELRVRRALFDNGLILEEQLPRKLEIEFIERENNGKRSVIMRCNGINIGDRITDNHDDNDDYRFHDVFHFAYATYLGWSPVLRALFKCKRKSIPKIDENQDGARAAIIEEAISAMVFARAKLTNRYEGLNEVDYDLLKSISSIVKGYEVDVIPQWQWQEAIIEGFKAFRLLVTNKGGKIHVDLNARTMTYSALY